MYNESSSTTIKGTGGTAGFKGMKANNGDTEMQSNIHCNYLWPGNYVW